MSVTSRVERVSTPDGELDAHVTLPASGSGPGIVVLQEIFGVGGYIKEATERLAGIGYVALAPDLYWRIKPGIALDHTEEGMGEAFHTAQQLDHPLAVSDSIAALKALRALPEVTGGRGRRARLLPGRDARVRGRDRGRSRHGRLLLRVRDPRDARSQLSEIRCTVLFHFGGLDPYIPREQAERVCAFARTQSNMECHLHLDAGHAFDNHEAPMFHQPEPAAVPGG